MKVLLITPNYDGTKSWMKCAINTSEVLKDNDLIVNVLTTNTEEQKSYEVKNEIHIHRIKSKLLPDPLNLSVPNIIQFWKTLKKLTNNHNFGAVIINKTWFVTSLIAAIYFRLRKTRYYVQLDTMVGKIWFGENKIMNVAMWIYARTLNRFILSGAEKCIIYHEGLVPVMKQWKLDYKIISQGVDLQKFNNAQPAKDIQNFKKEKVCFLFVGRLDEIKRYKQYLEVVERVNFMRKNVCFVFVCGNKHPLLIKEMQSKYPFVKFYGYRSDVAEVMKASDVLVLPSKCEGMPDVIMEAQAAGLCCVASNVGGIPNLVLDSVNGYTFDTWEDLEKKMFMLADFKSRREFYVGNAFETVKEHDSLIVGKKLTALLHSKQPSNLEGYS